MKKLFISLFSLSLIFVFEAKAGEFLKAVAGNSKIYRGRAPKNTEYDRIVQQGINTVIIFKNQNKSEVDDEIKALIEHGVESDKIFHIPLEWRDIKSEIIACEQIISALQVVAQVANSNSDKVLFHCTVGEDRTGLLAGLTAQLLEVSDMKTSYLNEMCKKGYSDGNRSKPAAVSAAVDENLTPLFYKISSLIAAGKVSQTHLNKSVCRQISKISYSKKLPNCRKLL